METTYVLNRAQKGVLWFTMAVGAAGVGFMLVNAVRTLHRLPDLAGDKQAIGISTLLVCLFAAVAFAAMLGVCLKMLRYTVTVSNEAIRAGNRVIPWEEIENVTHPARHIGLAFRINARDGSMVDVFPVVDADKLENLVQQRTALRAGTASATEEKTVEYLIGWKWCVFLVFAQLLCAGGATAAFVGLLARVSGSSDFGATVLRLSRGVPFLLLLPAILTFVALLHWVKRISAYSVTLMAHSIRLGDVAVGMSEINRIERSELPGVAFVVRTQDGRGINVCSVLKNVRELESMLMDRLSGRPQ